MATLDEIAQALIVAEQQGDAEAVNALAQAYQEQKAAQTQAPVLQDTGQGRFTSALSNVARGVTSIGPNVVGGLGYLTGSETLQEAGESMEQSLQRAFPVNPLYENEFSQKAFNVIGQAGSTLATGGVGGSIGKALGGASAVGRGAQAGAQAAAAARAAQAAAINKGAQAGALIPAFLAGTRGGGQEAERYGMTGGAAYARALLGGGIELASEKLLFGLGTETDAARRLLGESLDFGKGALLKAAGTEAGEEAAAQIGGNVATMALAPEGVETPGAFEGTLESAALGAVGGGFLGGVNALTGQPRKPVLDAEGNQVTVEGQPVFEDDLTPPEELPESVAPLTIADVQDDQVLEPVIEAASETVIENADVLPITNQVLQEINAPTETETLPGEPVPEIEAEAPAQEAPVTETRPGNTPTIAPKRETFEEYEQRQIAETNTALINKAVSSPSDETIVNEGGVITLNMGKNVSHPTKRGVMVATVTDVELTQEERVEAKRILQESELAETSEERNEVRQKQRDFVRKVFNRIAAKGQQPVRTTPTNETAQVEVQETGGPVAVEQLATEALPEDQVQEGAEVGESEGAEVEVAPQRDPNIAAQMTPEEVLDAPAVREIQEEVDSLNQKMLDSLRLADELKDRWDRRRNKDGSLRAGTGATFRPSDTAPKGVGKEWETHMKSWASTQAQWREATNRKSRLDRSSDQLRTSQIEQHKEAITEAVATGQPVSAAAVDAYGIQMPDGYTKVGDLYLRKTPQSTQRIPSRRETPRPQSGQTVEFRREGTPIRGVYQGQDELGRHRVQVGDQVEFVASTPAVIENTPIQGVTTPETFPDKGVELSAASMRSRGRRGLTVQETETIAQNFSKALRKGPPVRVVTADQIANDAEFSEVRDAVGKVGGKVNQVEGWFDRSTNTVFLVADQVANARRARQVLIHEVIGHGGVMSVATPAEMRRIADIIRRVAPRIVSNVETYYKNASDAEKVREILARFSEDYTSADPANLPQGWKRAWEEIKQIVRAIIKKMGGDPNAFDDLDLHRFYTNAVRAVYEEGIQPTQESDTMMSLNYPGTEEAKEEIRRQEEAGVTNARETRARFAPADKENLRHIPTTQADFIKAAEEFMDSLPLAEAAQRVLDGQVPENMRPGEDGRQHVLVAEAIRRLSVAAESTTDPYEQAEYLALANQMALKFAREGTADGRALNSRATANTLLAPIAPVLAAQRIMRERITKTLDARFDGGTEAVTQRVRKVSEDAAAQASEDVAAELEDEAEVESEANDLRQRAEVEAERIISSLVRPKEYEKAEVHPVRAVYNEHMEKPMERAAFEARVISLGVDPQTAANLYSIAEQELRGRQMSEQLKQRKKTEAILAKDSPKLVELLNKLRKKMFPGTNWRAIFEDLPDQQLARQKAIYERLRKDERLRNLTTEEGVALTNELDKAWQRQRRKVFLEDLKRQGVLGEKDAADRQKVAKAYPKIIRALNLGTFNSELMREAMASEYGIRTITAQEASELRKLAQEAYKQPEGILRNKKVAEVINKLQNATGSSISELVNNYWVASVLSGTATMFDTYMSAFNGLGNNLLQAGALFARGQRGDALAAVSQWFEGLRQGARESMLILAKGDYSVLKRFGTDLNKALEGDPNFRPIPLGESLWRNGNAFQKIGMAPIMMWTGRLMSAADHINNTATSYGAMAVARALHPEIYEGKGAFTKVEKDAAREQALREVTGGAPPQTLEEKATVSKRTREILAGLLTTEQQEEANFIGDQAAYQNDPLGLFGSIYQGISAGIGTIERKAEALSTDPAVQSQFMRAILGGLAGGLRGLTGTKFMRFGFNFGNDITQYIPGTYLLQKLAPVYGTKMSRSQQELLLGKNIFGLMAAVGVAAMFLDKDDDEEGWHIEGNWSGLNNDFKNQLRSQGKEPNTFWRRRPDGSIQRISYRSWPTSGIMVAVGSMNDQKRYQPAKWQETGLAAHLLRAVGNGALQVKDTTALSGLSELLGVSSYSTDPEKSAMERLAKTAFKFEGGFFPSLLKDIDSWEDPNNYRPETLLGEMVRHVPLARRSASDGRPMLNLLGEPVEMSRVPWRRVYTESKEGPEYTVLGQLLSRGLSLPEPSSKRTVNVDGQTTTIEQMGPRAEWEFARILGEKYREFLLREGPTLERLDNDRAEKRIRKRAQDLGDQAENEMVRLLKANP